ncbi:MAG: hypothetical protein ABIN89_29380 [Chitinophagaceae bacterium]
MVKRSIKFRITILSLVSILISMPACNEAMPTKEIKPPAPEVVVVKSDSAQVQANITDFLIWYKLHYKTLIAFPILGKNSLGNFMVNKTAYTGFLNFLTRSNFIAPQYIGLWRIFFEDKEAELKQNPLRTGIPEGFDFDFVLITAQPQILLNKIDSIQYNITSMSDSAALVGVKWPDTNLAEYEFEMFKSKEGWQIGYISTPNFD